MGRFDRQYPAEAIAELFRLTLEARPPLTAAAAVEAIAESDQPWRCSINIGTARAYVRDERRKRGVALDAEGPTSSPSALRGRLLRLVARELRHEERKRAGQADIGRVRTLAQVMREAEAKPTARRAPSRVGAQGDGDAGGSLNGHETPATGGLSPAAQRLIDRARTTETE